MTFEEIYIKKIKIRWLNWKIYFSFQVGLKEYIFSQLPQSPRIDFPKSTSLNGQYKHEQLPGRNAGSFIRLSWRSISKGGIYVDRLA